MKKLILPLVALLLVAAAAAWYFLRKSNDARNVIPSDAIAVAEFEPFELVRTYGLSVTDIPKMTADGYGIDFTRPIYAFITKNGLMCLTLNVTDEKAFTEFVRLYWGFASEEERGMLWLSSKSTTGYLADGKAIIAGPLSIAEQDAVKPQLAALLRQGRQDVPLLDEIEKQQGVLRLAVPAGSLLAQSFSQQQLSESGVKLSPDAMLFAALRFGPQDVTISASISGLDKELTNVFRPIEGSIDGLQASFPFLRACTNISGDKLLPLLRRIPQLRTTLLALNMVIDADMMLRAVDGDVTLTLSPCKLPMQSDYLLTAELSNTDFLAHADDWKTGFASGVQFVDRGNNDYLIIYDGKKVFFGLRDGRLYVTSNPQLNLQTALPEELEAEQGKYLRAYLDAKRTLDYLGLPHYLHPYIAGWLNRLTLTVTSAESMELQLTTKQPIEDILSKITGKDANHNAR